MSYTDDLLYVSAELATLSLHGDHRLAEALGSGAPVAPDISLSTTFTHSPYDGEAPPREDRADWQNPKYHIYSRYSQPTSGRVEEVLSSILHGHALTYRSGLAAAYSAFIHYNPKRIAIRKGYHGVHSILKIFQRAVPTAAIIDIDDELKEGDLLWLETPLNPKGEARDIQHYADKAHKAGAKFAVDATFAPPPLSDPFLWGADCVMHSGTKYFGGHSDLLAGVLVVKSQEEWTQLFEDRCFLGNGLGSLEAYLLLRSLRTLKVRVQAQSATATALAAWLHQLSTIPAGQELDGTPGGIIEKVFHSSLQTEEFVKKQLSGGHTPTFSITTTKTIYAKEIPFKLKFFTNATSLGGVETLIEQRLLSDSGEDPKLIRISVGLEDLKDLKADLRAAFKYVLELKA